MPPYTAVLESHHEGAPMYTQCESERDLSADNP